MRRERPPPRRTTLCSDPAPADAKPGQVEAAREVKSIERLTTGRNLNRGAGRRSYGISQCG